VRSRWFVAALLLNIATALALMLLPTVAVHEGYGPATPDGNGRVVTTGRVVSLWADQPTVAFVLAIPVLLCALPLLVRPRRRRAAAWVGATALAMFVLLGLLSVGLFFLPGVVLMVIGAVQLSRRDS
jgi:hypothetical protein